MQPHGCALVYKLHEVLFGMSLACLRQGPTRRTIGILPNAHTYKITHKQTHTRTQRHTHPHTHTPIVCLYQVLRPLRLGYDRVACRLKLTAHLFRQERVMLASQTHISTWRKEIKEPGARGDEGGRGGGVPSCPTPINPNFFCIYTHTHTHTYRQTDIRTRTHTLTHISAHARAV